MHCLRFVFTVDQLDANKDGKITRHVQAARFTLLYTAVLEEIIVYIHCAHRIEFLDRVNNISAKTRTYVGVLYLLLLLFHCSSH